MKIIQLVMQFTDVQQLGPHENYPIAHAIHGCSTVRCMRPTKIRHIQQLDVAEICILRWMCDHTRKNKVRNDDIRNRIRVALIAEKLDQHRLRWFGHIQRMPPVKRADNVKRGQVNQN
jgi:hypothetical protein